MTSTINPKILERVRKMLRLANDAGASDGERDNALRMAHATLAKFNLDMAAVNATDTASGISRGGEERIKHTASFLGFPWARHLVANVAELFFCSIVTCRVSSTSDNIHYYFIGRTSNAVTASMIAEYLVRSIYREANRRMRSECESWAWLRSFCWGAAKNLTARAKALKAHNEKLASEESVLALPNAASTPGTAVVLASLYQTESAANEEFVTAAFDDLRRTKARRQKGVRGDAYVDGQTYGSRLSLTPQLGK